MSIHCSSFTGLRALVVGMLTIATVSVAAEFGRARPDDQKQPTTPPVNEELGITGEAPKRASQPLAKVPDAINDVILLQSDDAIAKQLAVSPGPSLFHREMIRQSLWLAAHEEFGLRVRDAALGETAPEGLPADRQFRLRQAPLSNDRWTLVVGKPEAEHRLWGGVFLNDTPSGAGMGTWIETVEKLSRRFQPACLEAAGFKPKANRKSDAAVPRDVEIRLAVMRETDQFAAVRALHSELRTKGESDALVAALIQAYAHLGLLTEHHWNATPMVFKARALLYAQRLVARNPKSAAALRLRAYAEALAGAHRQALVDLETAVKLPEPAAEPAWLDAIAAYLRFDRKRMDAARANSDTSLVRLLQFLIDEEAQTPLIEIKAGRRLLETDPEIYRVRDAMCRVGGVSNLHSATVDGLDAFLKNMPKRVGEMPGVPEPVAESTRGGDEAAIYTSLIKAGAEDRGEPSWRALGTILRENRFTLTVHRFNFVSIQLGASTAEAAKETRGLFRDHPLHAFIESYELDAIGDADGIRKKLASVPIDDMDLKGIAYFFRYRAHDFPAASKWFVWTSRPEWLYGIEAHIARINTPSRAASLNLGARLKSISPYSPLGNALYLAEAKPDYEKQFPELEKIFSEQALVQKALGERYVALRKLDEAERCWTKWVALSPDLMAFQRLAEIHKAKGDMKRWQTTLEGALEQEDVGLNHAQIRVQLANAFITLGDFKKAEPFAKAAADTGAEWALLCLARCKVGLKEFKEANELYKASAQRYPASPFDWYFACRAYGNMETEAAEKSVMAMLERIGERLPQRLALQAGRYYLMTGKKDKALAAFIREDSLAPNGATRLFVALAADAAGDAKTRTQALEALAQDANAPQGFKPLGKLFEEWFSKAEPPGEDVIGPAIEKLLYPGRVDAEFFVGWYLLNRGHTGRAVVHWKRCKDALDAQLAFKVHCDFWIREHSKMGPPNKP